MSAIRHSLVCTLLVLAGCQSASTEPSSSSGPAPSSEYTLVLLKTGARREALSAAERSQVFGGHMGNIQKLAREKHLVVAGPYGKDKSDPSLRGLFVLDTADRLRAQALAETDPGFQAGVFALEYHEFSTDAPLRAFLAAELAAQEEAKQSGREVSPADGIRGYVLLTADNGDAAAEALAGNPAVLWFARLDKKRAFVLLDAKDEAMARDLLGAAALRFGAFRLDEWSASGRLAQLPKLGRG